MKKIVKLAGYFLTLVLLTGSFLPQMVSADMIYEPIGNSFYDKHSEECTYVSRSYVANGPNGTVTVYQSPESARKIAVLENGEQLYVSYTYQDGSGILWGCCEQFDTELQGWVPMDYLTVIYDEISFREEHSNQIEQAEGSLEGMEIEGAVYFWQYPGSQSYWDLELTTEYAPEFQYVYTDTNGVKWGRCAYYLGLKGCWINLNDPTADFETLYPDGIQPTEDDHNVAEENQDEMAEIVPKENLAPKILAVLAVVAVVAVTVVMLRKLKKKET